MKLNFDEWSRLNDSFYEFRKYSQDIGFAWVSGADLSADDFRVIVDKYTVSYANDAIRRQSRFGESRIKDVDSGNDEMPLHSESSFSPNCPDAIWFYCVSAPSGENESTTACDGKHVWESLSESVKSFLINNQIEYSLCVDLNRQVPDRRWFVNRVGCGEAQISNGQIRFVSKRYAVNELFDSKGRPYLAFANHLFALLDRETQILSRKVDGKAIPEDLIAECEQVCSENTIDITWCDGDFVYLNNKRFMHGRRAIALGSTRDIVVSQSERAVF